MLSLEESLKILKETKALLDGHFILSSGLHSPQYVQCAQLMSKPKMAEKICLSLSEKIVSLFNILPISYPTTIPPIAGDKIRSNSLKSFFIFSEREEHILNASLGLLIN